MLKKLSPFIFILALVGVFFWQVFLKGLLPIPADTIVGLYHPYRDLYAKEFPRGITYKNFLITDPVRQQYLWKKLSMDELKSGKIPSWNPYSFSGTPNLANFQSSVFYPLNIIFILPSFDFAWASLIFLQPLLAMFFMFLYLRNLKVTQVASLFGSICFAFSGFFIGWLEWGTVAQTLLWLPLILLCIDKISVGKGKLWPGVLIFSLFSSFTAGHLQTFIYLFVMGIAYWAFRWRNNIKKNKLITVLICLLIFAVISSVQWIPTIQFILLSARDINQLSWKELGWFLPARQLVQFIIPDFFGNPATLNYWGVWNYVEMLGYVGILPLALAFSALLLVKNNLKVFFGTAILVCLILSVDNPIARIPYSLHLPLISTTQPTRLLSLVDFSLAILAAFGFDYILSNKITLKKMAAVIAMFAGIIMLFSYTVLGKNLGVDMHNLNIAARNMIFPVLIFCLSVACMFAANFLKAKNKMIAFYLIVGILIVDLFRFGWKFEPFTSKNLLFPETNVTKFLEKNAGLNRIAPLDPGILPPNFSIAHGLYSVDGYDPLYLERYGQLISSINKGNSRVEKGFGFDRIVSVNNYQSGVLDLMGVKYFLSLTDINSANLIKVFQEGQTRVYENPNSLPRAFLVQNVVSVKNDKQAIDKIFGKGFDPLTDAVVEGVNGRKMAVEGSVSIDKYERSRVVLTSDTNAPAFLVLTDSFYPTWHVKIDNKNDQKIYRTDYNFRGVFVPKGKHTVIFENSEI